MNLPIKLSCYAYLFNARVRDFDLDGFVLNVTGFFDEVVIATVASEDDTYERLRGYQLALGTDRFRVVMTKIDPLKDNRFDGNLKTAAMRECSKDPGTILVIADADERFPHSQRPLWDRYAEMLLQQSGWDGLLIPVVDLWGDTDHIRAHVPIGVKFRMHKHTVVRRGVPSFAERADGLMDTSRTDSTEPLLSNGILARFASIIQSPSTLQPQTCHSLVQYPYVLHLGYIDLERRAKLGREFWKSRWEERSGRREDVATHRGELDSVPVLKHNLGLV